jgi:DNA-binding NarL/FixJ family response regulator
VPVGNARGSVAARHAALFGRTEPLARLDAAVRAGRPFLVRGEAGIGKTVLVREAIAGVERPVVAGRGIRALRDVPYLPLRRAVSDMPTVGERADVVAAVRARHAGAIVMIDDLHWCDTDTLVVLEELCLSMPVVATVRTEASPADALVARLVEVGEVVDLGPLDDEAARRLVEHRCPGAPTSDIDRWVAGASGNPLMLELAASVGADATGTRPGAAVLNAVGSLDAAAVDALARIALAATPLGIDDRARAMLVAHQFVDVLADGRVEIRHDLVGEAAVELIGADRRRALHVELAESAADAAARARHLNGAGRYDEVAAAAVAAAADAETVWSRAQYLLLAAEHAQAGEQLALRVDAAEQLSLAGQYRDVVAVLEGVDVNGDADLAIRAGVALARAYWTETQIEDARRVIAATLDLIAGRGCVAESELLSLQSRILARVDWDLRGAIELGRASLAIARSCGDGFVAAHSALGLALLMVNNPEWSRHIEAAGVYARDEHDFHGFVVTFDILLFGHFHAGTPSRCRAIADEMVRATEVASPAWNGYFRAAALMVGLHVDGQYSAVLEQGPRLLDRRLSTRAREMTRTTLAIARADAGDDQAARQLAHEAVEHASDDAARSTAAWALAETHWLGGREEAIAASDMALDLSVGSFPGRVNAVLIGQWARVDHGIPVDPRAEAVLAKVPRNASGAQHELRGLSAREPSDALDAFEAAAEAWEGCSQRAAVRARWAAGEAARRAGRDDRALTHLLAAEQTCRALGLVPLGRRVDRSLRALDRIAPSTRRSGLFSAAELRVLQCVARGLTTQQIARYLALQPSTVESHIRAVMRATGATTRLQAATIALGTLATTGAARAVNFVTRDDDAFAAGVERLRRDGATVVPWDELPPEPWTLGAAEIVGTGTVAGTDDVAGAVLAASRGARIVARLPDDARLTAEFVDSLQRVGAVAVLGPRTADARGMLEPVARRIFDLLAAGFSITDVAAEIGYSRRTIERRTADARRRLGVATNVEALLVLRKGPAAG